MKRYKVGPWKELGTFTSIAMKDGDHLVAEGQIDPDELLKLKEVVEGHGYVSEEDEAGEVNIWTKYPHAPVGEDSDEDDDPDQEPFTGNPNDDDPEPYIITEAEFSMDMPEYSKISLTYYAGDDVVCDEQERVVEDVESTIASRNLSTFPADTMTVYIRNNRIKADFEVTLDNAKYSEAVMGLEAPVERRGRKRRLEE